MTFDDASLAFRPVPLDVFDVRFGGSQFAPVTGDGRIGLGQEGSQVDLRDQVTLDLQDQSLEFAALCHGH